jgi:hypothetical protein
VPGFPTSVVKGAPEGQLLGDLTEGFVAGSNNLVPNRCVVTALTASHMALLAHSRPPSSVTEMWCGNPRYLRGQRNDDGLPDR